MMGINHGIGLVSLILLGGSLGGCSSMKVDTEPYYAGTVLLLPIEDAWEGTPSARQAVKGSGHKFQDQLSKGLAKSQFRVSSVTGDYNGYSLDAILAQAREANLDYYLHVELGQFRNPKKGAWKPDYAHVETAMLYNIWTEHVVWELSKPLYAEKSNDGNSELLLEVMAAFIDDSIVKEAKASDPGEAQRYLNRSRNQYYYQQGLSLVGERKLEQAIVSFQKALSFNPNDTKSKQAIRMSKDRLSL
jgi:tetratricopeptide (TPR) repeat protein